MITLNKEMQIIKTDIDLIQVGDLILHNGRIRTICKKDIDKHTFMGTTIFGDSYNLGYIPVKKIINFNLNQEKEFIKNNT